MQRRTALSLMTGGIGLAALIGAVAVAPSVSAQSAVPIGPRQVFTGLVNGKHPTSTITVFCPGPIRVGQTGHPVGGQTVGVRPAAASTTGTGFTGSLGRSIVVTFANPVATGPGPATNPPITFTSYGTQPIPTSLTTPCGGRGAVIFSPRPTSRTARNAVVQVTYENIAATLDAG